MQQQESVMPRINQQQAQALFDPDVTQPIPRVSMLVDRRQQVRRREDRGNGQERRGEDRPFVDRRRKKRRRTDVLG
jgi:hypothetical protein